MTLPDLSEPRQRELDALYREAAADEPGPALDRRILDAARTELKSATASKARPLPWWKRWLPATTAIAAVAVGVSLTWRVMDEQERQVREELQALPAAPDMKQKPAADTAAPAPAAGSRTAPAAVNAPVATERGAAATAQPPAAPEPRVFTAPAAPAAVMPQEVEAKKAARAEVRETESRRDAVVQDAAPALSRAAPKLESGRLGASSEAAGAISSAPAAKALAAPEAVSPEAWLRRIRELRSSGRDAEATQSLALFRQRYPDFPLPADLK